MIQCRTHLFYGLKYLSNYFFSPVNYASLVKLFQNNNQKFILFFFFPGCCVGYHNHRYFLMGIFYIFIGALYGIYYQWEYVYETINLPVIYFFLCLLAPHFALLFGAINLWGVLVATLHTLGLATLLMVSYLLLIQAKAICQGQTQYEMKHNIHDYNLSLRQNIVDVLGRRWKVAWISPFIMSPLTGDGLKFLRATEYEPPKDI